MLQGCRDMGGAKLSEPLQLRSAPQVLRQPLQRRILEDCGTSPRATCRPLVTQKRPGFVVCAGVLSFSGLLEAHFVADVMQKDLVRKR